MKVRCSRRGAYSEMYSAVATANGTAIEIAVMPIRIVPTRIAAIPKWWESGSQACVVRNDQPATRSASVARRPRKAFRK